MQKFYSLQPYLILILALIAVGSCSHTFRGECSDLGKSSKYIAEVASNIVANIRGKTTESVQADSKASTAAAVKNGKQSNKKLKPRYLRLG